MDKFDRLDEYSKAFADWMFRVQPELREFAEVVGGEEDCYLEIIVPSPADGENKLWIYTCDNEITVGFAGHHEHLGYNKYMEDDFKEANELIMDIVNERLIVIEGRKNKDCRFSTSIKPSEIERYKNLEIAAVKSWNGTYK